MSLRFSTMMQRLRMFVLGFDWSTEVGNSSVLLRGSAKPDSLVTFCLVGCGNLSLVETETFLLVRLGCALFAFYIVVCNHLTKILCMNLPCSPVFTSVL